MAKQAKKDGRKTVVRNKRAFHDYEIGDRYEAGMVLLGSEVKSLRDGNVNLSDAYAEIIQGEAYLVSAHIAEYAKAAYFGHEAKRRRKLLLNRHELRRLQVKLSERGYTLVPLSIYFKQGKAKVELGLGKGKRQYDKRESLKRRDQLREAQSAMRRR